MTKKRAEEESAQTNYSWAPDTNTQWIASKPIAFALANRAQNDTLSDQVSIETGLDTGTDTPVRVEYGPETDINTLLRRFNIDQQGRPFQFQEVDYNMDLQSAHLAVEAAQSATQTVPPELRHKYPTWAHVLNGAENGEYARDLQALDDKKTAEKAAADTAAAAKATPETTPKAP